MFTFFLGIIAFAALILWLVGLNGKHEEACRCDRRRKLGDALRKLAYDKILVDTNVFMNAADETFESVEAKKAKDLAKDLFIVVKSMKLKIFILTSQLNELVNIKKKNRDKGRLVRHAQKIMEELQSMGLLGVLDDVVGKKNYADPEIIKVARKFVKEGHKPLVITEEVISKPRRSRAGRPPDGVRAARHREVL